MISNLFCILLLILVGALAASTVYFAHGKLKAYRLARLWMNNAHRMQRAAAQALPFNHPLVTTINGLYDAASYGLDAETRL